MASPATERRCQEAPCAPVAQAAAAVEAAFEDAGLKPGENAGQEVVEKGVAVLNLVPTEGGPQGTAVLEDVGGVLVAIGGIQGSGRTHRLRVTPEEASSGNKQGLWVMATDRIAARMAADCAEMAGRSPPPRLLALPAETKLRALAFLGATDLASVSCVSRELRALSADDSLWAPLFVSEVGQPSERDRMVASQTGWKSAYANRRSKAKDERRREAERLDDPLREGPVRRPPGRGVFPFSARGGDDDLLPGGGGGPGMPFPRGPRGGGGFPPGMGGDFF